MLPSSKRISFKVAHSLVAASGACTALARSKPDDSCKKPLQKPTLRS